MFIRTPEPECQFSLSSGNLLDAVLTEISEDHFQLSLTVASVCADARSLRIIAEELVAACDGGTESSDGGPVQYADAAEYFNSQLESGAVGRQYWHSRIVPLLAPSLPSNCRHENTDRSLLFVFERSFLGKRLPDRSGT